MKPTPVGTGWSAVRRAVAVELGKAELDEAEAGAVAAEAGAVAAEVGVVERS
jgi:hypothetical protein